MAYRQHSFPNLSVGPAASGKSTTQTSHALLTSSANSRVDFHIVAKDGKGTAITSLRIPYAHQHDSELFLDLQSLLIRAKKDQTLPDDMPNSLKSFKIVQHTTLDGANATADRERSKLCLSKGPTLRFVGTGTLPPRLPESDSSELSSSDEEPSDRGKTDSEVPKGDTGTAVSLEAEFFGLKSGAELI